MIKENRIPKRSITNWVIYTTLHNCITSTPMVFKSILIFSPHCTEMYKQELSIESSKLLKMIL